MRYIFLCCFFLLSLAGLAQVDSTQPPFLRFRDLPPIQILLSDSTSFYTKAQLPKTRPVLFMVFSPECSHCQHETEELIAHKEDLKDVQIVMITMHPLWMMNDFISRYKLTDLPNVVVGRDVNYFMPGFYNIHNLPFLSMYNKNGKLISAFEGSLGMEKVIEVFKENK